MLVARLRRAKTVSRLIELVDLWGFVVTWLIKMQRLAMCKQALEEWVAARRREGQNLHAQSVSPHGLFSPGGKKNKKQKKGEKKKAKKERMHAPAAPPLSSPYPSKPGAVRSSSSSCSCSHEEVQTALRLLKVSQANQFPTQANKTKPPIKLLMQWTNESSPRSDLTAFDRSWTVPRCLRCCWRPRKSGRRSPRCRSWRKGWRPRASSGGLASVFELVVCSCV